MEKEEFKKKFKNHFFEIIDQSRNGITICNPTQQDNPLIYVNQAFLDIFEYSYDECMGKNCRFLQGDDKEQQNLQLIRDAIKNQTSVTTVLRNYTKNGKLIYNEVRVSPIFNKQSGELQLFLGIQKELSTSKQMANLVKDNTNSEKSYENIETALQELDIFQAELLAQNEELIEKDKRLEILNREFYSLFHEAPIAYVVINKELTIQRYNKKANEYFNFSKQNQNPQSFFRVTKDKNREDLVLWIQNEQYSHAPLEIDMICTTGENRHYKLHGKRYMINEKLILVSLSDITESYQIKTELENRVKQEVAIKLKQEKFILKQAKLASMGEMIDAIAHQWLNPLSLIKLYAQDSELLLEDDIVKYYETILSNQQKIDTQVIHMVNTLNEFRSFYRPDEDSELLDANEMINSTLYLMKDELIKQNIQCHVEAKRDFVIKAIKNQFKHVILNLLTNSRDAFIEKSIENRRINITIDDDENYNIITFFDNAGGIPTNYLSKIFEPNFTTKGKGKGSGVGLYLCKQILDKFNVSIDVENVTDGVCFTIKFSKDEL